MQVIIYKHEGESKAIYPTPDAVAVLGIHTIALKDVPAGAPYKIIDATELPSRDERDAWDFDEAALMDGIGGNFGVGTQDEPIGYMVDAGIVATKNVETGEVKAYDLNQQDFIELTQEQ